MNTKIYLVLLTILCVFSLSMLSCNSNLSKSDAKKQIDTALKEKGSFCMNITTQNCTRDEMRYLENAKKAGFLTYNRKVYQPYSSYPAAGIAVITLLDKIKPFIDKYEPSNNHLSDWIRIMVTSSSSEIESMAEPAPDGSGSIVCNVTYKIAVAVNELGQAFEIKSDPQLAELIAETEKRVYKARFVKMQDGWKLDKTDFGQY